MRIPNKWGTKTIQEEEDLFLACLCDVKRKQDVNERCDYLSNVMALHLGPFISKDCLLDILEYLDLTPETFTNYVNYSVKYNKFSKFQLNWYHDLIKQNGNN